MIRIERIKGDGCTVYRAVSGGRVLGFASLGIDGELEAIQVNKNARGQRVGSKLIGAVEESARADGVTKITGKLRPDADSTKRSRNFFEGKGFQINGDSISKNLR